MENIRIKYFTDKIDKLEYIDGNLTGLICEPARP